VCIYMCVYVHIYSSNPQINLLFNKEGRVYMADREECTKNTLIYSVSTRFLNLCGFEQETEINKNNNTCNGQSNTAIFITIATCLIKGQALLINRDLNQSSHLSHEQIYYVQWFLTISAFSFFPLHTKMCTKSHSPHKSAR
jgi:hypothetical protein